MRKLNGLILLLFVLVPTQKSNACFILFLSDGKQILVGNHEDWFAKDAAIKINPPSSGKFGSVIFTFLNEGWAQGGMNEKGLFFDAARTPFQAVSFNSDANQYPGYIWQAVLDKCASVEEAIRFLNHYELPDLTETDIMLADATGHAVILGVHNGKVAVKPFVQTYLMQTNFNPWHPELSEEPTCWRYEKSEKHLSVNSVASLENMKSILEQTHQDSLTVYSNVYDLKNKIIYTYNKRNFKKAIITSLPEVFQHGNCMVSLDSLAADSLSWKKCVSGIQNAITLSGKVVDVKSGKPIPFTNIGILSKNIGTLSDPDGSFELSVPFQHGNDSVVFSSIGFANKKIPITKIKRSKNLTIGLDPSSAMLSEVVITAKKTSNKISRLGWMGGKDGVLPFDTIQGGGTVAVLIESPSMPFSVEKLQVRLMYNSKDTCKLRLHFYSYDSAKKIPGHELLSKEIILKETKRFGWLRFSLSAQGIILNEKHFFIGFEWIDDRQTRKSLLEGFRDWEKWKKDQYEIGNKSVEYIFANAEAGKPASYKYHGNMMNWPGFKKLPPFTGLMVQTGKDEKTIPFKTFERKTSFGPWTEIHSTLNAVVTIKY
jgi:predicted choloylglycine hydrolase